MKLLERQVCNCNIAHEELEDPRINNVMEILALRSGHAKETGISAEAWAGDIQFESDFIDCMHPQTFQLLLEMVCMLPDQHPLHIALRRSVKELMQ